MAHNLRRARALRGWTQEGAAEKLEPYLGDRWSKANFSAAERSVGGNRIRQFHADEILAFAQAFGLPVVWFFLPPDDQADNPKIGRGIEAVMGDRTGKEELDARLGTLFNLMPRESWTETQKEELRESRKRAASDFSMVEAMLPNSSGMAATLTEVAKFIDDLPKKPKKAGKTPGVSKAAAKKRQE